MLILKEVSKAYKDKVILKDISYCFEDGKVIAIVAPNGAGKTTLLSVISGLVLPDKGSITHDKENIGIVLAGDKNLYLKNTVLENLYFWGALQGVKKQQVEERVQYYREYFPGLDEIKNKLVEHLSYGQKRIVSLLSCFITDAEIILLDEVTEGLDMQHIRILQEMLEEYKENRTILLVSHDYDFIAEISDEIVSLKDGQFEKVCKSGGEL